MRRLELYYLRLPRRTLAMRWVLVAVAVAFVGDAGRYYLSLARRVAEQERDLARLSSIPREPAKPSPPASATEYSFARETVTRLSVPWEPLFFALESAQTKDIALLSIEPDAERGTVTIKGQAKDYLAALGYVASLGEQPALTRVHLARHEPQNGNAFRPVGFSVSAAWRETR